MELAVAIKEPQAISKNSVPVIETQILTPENILNKAKEISTKCQENIGQPKKYDNIEEGLRAAGLGEKAEIKNNRSIQYVGNGDENPRYILDLGFELMRKGPQYLKKFSYETRIIRSADGDDVPVIVAKYDLNERYEIVLGVSNAKNQNMGISVAGGIRVYLLIDKEDNSVVDLKSLIPEETKSYVVADENDFKGERQMRCQGQTDEKRLSARLITTSDALGSFLHEVGHARFYQSLNEAGILEQYQELVNNSQTNLGNLPTETAIQAYLLNEEIASEIGIETAKFIKDETLKAAIFFRLNFISKRYKEKMEKKLEE